MAAIEEYQKVVENDPKNPLAQQALFRIGLTQCLYTGAYEEAAKSFRKFTFVSQDTNLVYQAEKNIGEIYFTKIEDHRRSIEQYQRLIGNYPDSREADFFRFRMAKSYYNSLKFKEAIDQYRQLIKDNPRSQLKEEAYYQIGNTYYTMGDYDAAIDSFEDLLSRFPKGKQAVFAQFGVANCFEEIDQLDEAYAIYSKIKEIYPNRAIVELKMKRVKERRANRNR